MQLLYPTAVETANRIGMKLNSYRDLYIPDTNITLGVKYLAVLLRMFKGNRFYAAASYNAGASNVKHWLKNYHADNLYDWCEKIPVEQTNRYIYKVIGAEHSYNLLYTKGYFKIGKVNLFKTIFLKDKE
jgi:soluble lytic murein transglycosylase